VTRYQIAGAVRLGGLGTLLRAADSQHTPPAPGGYLVSYVTVLSGLPLGVDWLKVTHCAGVTAATAERRTVILLGIVKLANTSDATSKLAPSGADPASVGDALRLYACAE
jgi:hypothetical protein